MTTWSSVKFRWMLSLQTFGIFAPPKCKFFLWLAHQRRLSTRDRLFRHNMRDSGECPFCTPSEDIGHLFLRCPRAISIWHALGLPTPHSDRTLEELWQNLGALNSTKPKIRSAVLMVILWNIWKCRNAKIFRHEDESNSSVVARCIEDQTLWSNSLMNFTDMMKSKNRDVTSRCQQPACLANAWQKAQHA
ncbi:hypothetical protein EJB05_16174, partial [Eragrostis curvula]